MTRRELLGLLSWTILFFVLALNVILWGVVMEVPL